MTNFSFWLKNLGGVIAKNGPSVLTGIAGLGLFSTAIFAGTGAIKACKIVEQMKLDDLYERNILISDWEPTKKEVVAATWTCFIPAVVTGAITLACMIGSNTMNLQRNAALAGLYSVTESAFKQYKNKVVDTLGRAKEGELRDKIAEDTIRTHPVSDQGVIITGRGNVRCFDEPSQRRFTSDVEKIKRIQNEINRRLLSGEDFIGLNEFYTELGLKHIQWGYDSGWEVNKGLLDISFSAQLDEDEEPCVVITYEVVGRYV